MSIDRWMGKEDVIYICKGILLSHKKQWIWVSSSEVDESTACYIGWIKLEKKIPYINTYIWNLEKYCWTYLKGRNGDTDKIMLNILQNGEGNGTPLQYSCLENPMEGGAW